MEKEIFGRELGPWDSTSNVAFFLVAAGDTTIGRTDLYACLHCCYQALGCSWRPRIVRFFLAAAVLPVTIGTSAIKRVDSLVHLFYCPLCFLGLRVAGSASAARILGSASAVPLFGLLSVLQFTHLYMYQSVDLSGILVCCAM